MWKWRGEKDRGSKRWRSQGRKEAETVRRGWG